MLILISLPCLGAPGKPTFTAMVHFTECVGATKDFPRSSKILTINFNTFSCTKPLSFTFAKYHGPVRGK